MSGINLSYIVLSSHLVQSFIGTIGISLIPCCNGNLVAIATKVKLYNFFVLSRIEFIFGMEIPLDNRHQLHTSLLR